MWLAQNTIQPHTIRGLQFYELSPGFLFGLGAGQAQKKDNCCKAKQERYFDWSHDFLTFR
jgi:hypothetical protein